MSKAANRIVLFILPLLFGLRELIFCANSQWETRGLSVTDWPPTLLRPSTNSRTMVLRPKVFLQTSFDLILTSIQRLHAADIDTDDDINHHADTIINIEHQQEQQIPRVQVRSFPRRNWTLPCFPSEPDWLDFETTQRTPASEGLFYIKTHKTASTTVMGVTIRIAKKLAERNNAQHHTRFHACKARFEPWPARLMDYRFRKRDHSFLFAVLREPTRRAISM